MTKFNIGDTVKQVGEQGPGNPGDEFTVSAVGPQFMDVTGENVTTAFGGTGWYLRRFELVKAGKAPAKLQPLPARILKHLQSRKTISPVEAMAAYGTTRLAAAIFQLRKAGYLISTEYRNDAAGHPYARYWLIQGAAEDKAA